jgi:predicted amidohydrolase YtcJ
MKQEAWRRSLAPGMAADLTALDRDPFAGDSAPLRNTRVLLTVVRKEIVHDQLPAQPVSPIA